MSPSPYYADEFVTLYHDDSEDWLRANPGQHAQIVVTSPPYNMGLVPGGNGRGMYRPGANNKGGRFRHGYTGTNDDALDQGEYDAWQRRMLALLWDVVTDDGAVFYNHRPRVEHGVLPAGTPRSMMASRSPGTGSSGATRRTATSAPGRSGGAPQSTAA